MNHYQVFFCSADKFGNSSDFCEFFWAWDLSQLFDQIADFLFSRDLSYRNFILPLVYQEVDQSWTLVSHEEEFEYWRN